MPRRPAVLATIERAIGSSSKQIIGMAGVLCKGDHSDPYWPTGDCLPGASRIGRAEEATRAGRKDTLGITSIDEDS